MAEQKNVKLHLLGYRTDISELYNSADIFVFPSIREGLSVSLMEAMASGLPCIVSKIRGNVDLILVPADTRKYLVDAFELLYTKCAGVPDKKHGTK